jgi:hypothetical protein
MGFVARKSCFNNCVIGWEVPILFGHFILLDEGSKKGLQNIADVGRNLTER